METQTSTGPVLIQGLVSLLGTCTYKQACVRTGGGMWPVYTVPRLTPPTPPPSGATSGPTGPDPSRVPNQHFSSGDGSAGYCKSPFIAFPRDFLLCTPNAPPPRERSRSSFLEPRRLQKGSHPPRARVSNPKPRCQHTLGATHTVANH